MKHLYILGTLVFTLYGQLALKWQMASAGSLPAQTVDKLWFLLSLLSNPWVISVMVAAGLAFLCWLTALTHFELSYAYPFMSLVFPMVLGFSWLFFHEDIMISKVVGTVLIVAGISIISRS